MERKDKENNDEIIAYIPGLLVTRVVWSLPLSVAKVYTEEVLKGLNKDTQLLDVDKTIIVSSLKTLEEIWSGEKEDEGGILKERYLSLIERFYPLDGYIDGVGWKRLTTLVLDSKYRMNIVRGLSQYLRLQEQVILGKEEVELTTSLSQWYIRCNQLIRYLCLYQDE